MFMPTPSSGIRSPAPNASTCLPVFVRDGERSPSGETSCELQFPNSLLPALHRIQKEPDQQRRIGGDQQLYIGIGIMITCPRSSNRTIVYQSFDTIAKLITH